MSPVPDAVPSAPDVMNVLRGVIDPELGSDIVELGMARGAVVDAEGRVTVEIALTTAGCPLRAQIQRDVRDRVLSLPGVTSMKIDWDELTSDEKATAMDRARRNIAERTTNTAVPANARVLMVASGKGGVGKSSVTVNLAVSLARRGFRVGLIDADIWGFSTPRMLGVDERLGGDAGSGQIEPVNVSMGAGSIDLVSMGLLVDDEETALMWRGLILQRAVRHFVEDVRWAPNLDYLLIDMPPGTGDVQMGLAKMLPRAEMLIVTTPSSTAQKVAIRAVNMGRKNFLRIVGVIENMSYFVTPDGEEHAIFGTGGGQELADSAGIPLLASIPVESAVAEGGDTGTPVSLQDSPAAGAFRELAELISTEVAPPSDMSGCSARMLDAVNAALDAHDQASA